MATSITSTQLDFNTIKQNLKEYLSSKAVFDGYDFEASGLSNILDVLAYNTHQNALIANFAINESYLGTAQLRSSMVSLAETIGYIPGSVNPAEAVLHISLNLAYVTNRPSIITIPSGKKFIASVDGIAYTFQTRENLTAYDDGNGLYVFKNLNDSEDILVYEGTQRTKRFIVAPFAEHTTYVIPDNKLTLNTVSVYVYASSSSSAYVEYTNVFDATTVTPESNLYYIKESPNGFYEMSFGDGNTMGAIPKAGNVIEVVYLSSNGPAANGATTFSAISPITVNAETYNLNVSTISAAAGGADKESIESIRQNAPFQFAAQNRMVTAGDYATTILRNFPTIIDDINAYGGELAAEPRFGTVILSVLYNSTISDETKANTETQIRELVSRFAIASFNVDFIEPKRIYVEVNTHFRYNPALSRLSLSGIQSSVDNLVNEYFTTYLVGFNEVYRTSNLLTRIDESSPAILSSRADVKIQQRIVPILGEINNFTLSFGQELAIADDINYTISSSAFKINNKLCLLRNKLNTTKLQVVMGGEVVVDNVGSYNPNTGVITITGFTPDSIVGDVDYIKISATPANQSVITGTTNVILELDTEASKSTAVLTTAEK